MKGQFAINGDRAEPLSLQLVRQLQEAIEAGRVVRGTRLPSTRSLARTLGVSRNIVLTAYEELAARGLVRSASNDAIRPDLTSRACPGKAGLKVRFLLHPTPSRLMSDADTMPGTPSVDLLQGTLDLLILRTLLAGPRHGRAIAERIQQVSGDILQVNQGFLYPALHRLEHAGWLVAEWGVSELGRRAKFYRLTPGGRRQLQVETETWEPLSTAIGRVLRMA